jgi:SAM-dependent methyltransferase
MRDGYLMEDEREAKRLADKVDADAWVERYLSHHLHTATHVLDAGCGPGTISAAVAEIAPRLKIVGLDASPARTAVAEDTLRRHPNAQVALGDVRHLPFPNDSFDLVYCRFLLEYVPDKQRAVDEFVRVCRPGGTIVLQDLDGQLTNNYPPDPKLEQGIARALAILGLGGFDPLLGRKLHNLLNVAGAEIEQVEAEPYHFIAGTIEPEARAQWELKLDIAGRALTRSGSDDADRLKRRFLAYLDRSDTITFSQVFTVTGRKRPAHPATAG